MGGTVTNSVSGAHESAGNEGTTETENAGTTENDPVFVDSSGRRPRWVRRVGWGMGGICVTYCLTLGLSLAGAAPFAPETLMPIRDRDSEPSIGAADGRDRGAPESSRSGRNDSARGEAAAPPADRPSETPTAGEAEGGVEEPAGGRNTDPDTPTPDRPTTTTPPAPAPPAGGGNPDTPDENDPGEEPTTPTDPTPDDPTPTDPTTEPSTPSDPGGTDGGGTGNGGGGGVGDVVDGVLDPVTDTVGGLLGGVLG